MRVLVVVGLLAICLAGPDSAQSVSDQNYLGLARCIGLTRGAGGDATAMQAALRHAGAGRPFLVVEKGRSRERDASLSMHWAGGEARAALENERAILCPAVFRVASL